MMSFKRLPAFTLVELIVVIAIIAILSTIGMMAYQGYTLSARDTARDKDLQTIDSAIQTIVAKGEEVNMVQKDGSSTGTSITNMNGDELISSRNTWVFEVTEEAFGGDTFSKTPRDPKKHYYYVAMDKDDQSLYQIFATNEKNNQAIVRGTWGTNSVIDSVSQDVSAGSGGVLVTNGPRFATGDTIKIGSDSTTYVIDGISGNALSLSGVTLSKPHFKNEKVILSTPLSTANGLLSLSGATTPLITDGGDTTPYTF